jgi:hypothetical protein
MAVSFGAGGAKLLKANHLAFFGRVYSTRMETASTHAIYVAALSLFQLAGGNRRTKGRAAT